MLLGNCVLYFKTIQGKDRLYQILCVYLALLFVVEVGCHIIGVLKPNDNLFLSHYYFNFQFLALSLFFYRAFGDQRLKAMVVLLLLAIAGFLIWQYSSTPELYWIFNMYEIALTSFSLILYIAIYLMQNQERYFYFCFGLLFYLACSCYIFLWGNTNMVFFEKPFLFDVWIFNSLFYILYQILIYKQWKTLNDK